MEVEVGKYGAGLGVAEETDVEEMDVEGGGGRGVGGEAGEGLEGGGDGKRAGAVHRGGGA